MALQNTTLVRIAALLAIVLTVALILSQQFAAKTDGDLARRSASEHSHGTVTEVADPGSDRSGPGVTGKSDSHLSNTGTETESDVPIIDLNSVTGIQEILDRLGIDRDDAQWARSRGFVWVPEVGFRPDNPYRDLSVEELKALATTGDEEARLALAMAIAETDPVAAIELFDPLAMNGNPEAMIGMVNAYGYASDALEDPDRWGLSPGPMAAIQDLPARGLDPEVETRAWVYVVDSYTGSPRTTVAEPPAEMWPVWVEACDRAVELYALIASQLAAEGRSMPDPIPVPFSPGSLDMDNMLMAACPPERLPTADFSRCHAIRIYDQGHTYDAFVCP